MKVLSAVEMICSEHGVLILDVYKRALTQPTFDQPVRVESLPNSQAVLGLLRQFQPGHKSRLLQEEYSGSLTKMYLELARLVSQSNCYQVTVGPIDEMVEKITPLVI